MKCRKPILKKAGAVLTAVILVFIAVFVIPMSLAQPSWSESFDSYANTQYLDGGPDDGGWKGWAGSPSLGAYVTDVQSRSSPFSVEITNASELVHEYTGYGSGSWVCIAMQYIPMNFSGTSYFILMSSYDDNGTTNEWAVQVHFDSTLGLVESEFTGEQLPISYGQWVELKCVINLDTDWLEIFYNGALLAQRAWTDTVQGTGGGSLNIATVVLFANGATPVYYDDISLSGTGGVNAPPVFGTPIPVHGSMNQPVSLTWWIPISDPEGDPFSWTIQCSNRQVNSQTDDADGLKSLMLSGLAYSTTYTVWVNATDSGGSGLTTSQWFTFTTKANLVSWDFLGNNVFFDDGFVGIGTTTPNTPLDVNGVIRSTSGGFMFPDGSLQTSAALQGEKGEKGDPGEQGSKGERGDPGAKGDRGDPGPLGERGERGQQGPKGDRGDNGSQGERGDPGAKGDTGDRGERGEPGQKGDKGDNGTKGDRGERGEQGQKGNKGDTGSKGDRGERGEQGQKGDKGDTGTKGDPGDRGERGPKGDIGAKGDRGEKGQKGDKGDTGSQGERGDPGAKGDKGDRGELGLPGPKGDRGDNGSKGDRGDVGSKGDPGDRGAKGEQGQKGDRGDNGSKGDRGDIGPKGDKGDRGMQGAQGPQGDSRWFLNGSNIFYDIGFVGIGTANPTHKLDVEGYVQAFGYYTGDIFFQKNGKTLWRMFEDEQGLYLQSLSTGKQYKFVLEETTAAGSSLSKTIQNLQAENEQLKQRLDVIEHALGIK